MTMAASTSTARRVWSSICLKPERTAASFVVTGCFGFIWLAPWLLLYRPPEKRPWTTEDDPPAPRRRAELFRYPQTWGLLLARFVSDPVWWFYLFWMPKYLVEQRGFTMVEMGMLAWLPYLSADRARSAGGWLP